VTEDGLHLFTQHWEPDGDPRAVVGLVHGYGEHCGRYGHVAEALNDVGAVVYAYDQRGYGRSDGSRAYVETFDYYLDDLEHFIRYVDARTPDVPRFLFGHSMGGLVVLRYALTRSSSADGLLLSAPAIEINPNLAPFLRKLAQILGDTFPRLPTVRSPEGAISRDPEVVEQAENDPLNYHGRVLARTGAEMIRAGEHAQSHLSALDLPFFIFHGTADELTSPSWSRRLYEEAGTADKTIQLYDGLYHETFNEPEKQQVLDDIRGWLSERID